MNWNGGFGDVGNTGTVTVEGKTYINTGSSVPVLQGKTLIANGNTDWIDGEWRIAHGGTFTNPSGKTFTTLFSGSRLLANPYGGTGLVNNLGTFIMSNGGTATFNVGFTNSGEIKGTGTLNFIGTFTNTGSYSPAKRSDYEKKSFHLLFR